MTEQEIESIKFFIKLANNYLINNADKKKDKMKMLFYHQVLENKLILEAFLKEHGIKL